MMMAVELYWLIDNVMKQLHDKDPKVQPAKLGSLLFGPVEEVLWGSTYNEITSEMIRELVLKGAESLLNVDANGF